MVDKNSLFSDISV